MGLDVGEFAVGGFFMEVIEHFLLDIDGDDFSLGDERCDAEGVVSGAGADVGDDGVGFEVEECDGFGGCFFFFAVVSFEPTDSGVAHDLGDFASHEDFADAIGGGVGVGVGGRFRDGF